MDYKVVTLMDRWDLFESQNRIESEVWPEFMKHDPVGMKNWMPFIESFKEYQLMIMEGDEILAIANSVPLNYKGAISDLPDDGWDWGLAKSMEDFEKGIEPNLLMGIQIVVNKRHQGRGLSAIAVKEMSALAYRKGLKNLVIPVRPSNKHQYPLIPMDRYIQWKNDSGFPYDNWLRVHIKCGGSIIKTCPTAMRIPGTVAEWKEWTGLDFPDDGDYIVPGALNPVQADPAKDQVLYIEPNVWVHHKPGA